MSLPDKFKLKKGFSKYVLREALKDVIPEEVYNRKVKLGYPAPEESFMRENADHIIKLFREAIEKGNKFIPHTLPGQFLSFTKKKKRFDPIFVRYLTFIIWAKEFNVKLTQFIQATTLPASMLLSESML